MVFYNWVVAMRPRAREQTQAVLKEIAVEVLQAGGVIRKLSNEGVMRSYRGMRDQSGTKQHYVRYVHMQFDLSEAEGVKMRRRFADHPDILKQVQSVAEVAPGQTNPGTFKLDAFTRMEEEIAWPPQVTADVYEQIDMNWKEFSKARWSNFLRS